MVVKYVLCLGGLYLLQHPLCGLEGGLHLPAAYQRQFSGAEGLMLECLILAI